MISKLIIKDIKKKKRGLVISAVLFLLLAFFLGVVYAAEVSSGKNSGTSILVMTIIVALIGILFLVCAIKSYSGGMECGYLKKRPEVVKLAKEMDEGLVYEDDFIMVSGNSICAKKNPCFNIARIEDVVLLYESIQRMNGIVTSHLIVFQLISGKSISVSVYAKNKATKNDILLTISHFCPNARVGYTNENLTYLQEVRKQYKG